VKPDFARACRIVATGSTMRKACVDKSLARLTHAGHETRPYR